MKNKFYLSLAVGLLFCLFGWAGHVRAQRSSEQRQTWEYKLLIPVVAGPSLEAQMNQLGAEGWELVAVKRDNPPHYPLVCFFKRAK